MSDLREFLDRGVVGASEVDLVEGVWRTSRRRRRNRRLRAGSAVAAVAVSAVVVSQWGGVGSSLQDLGPAGDTSTAPPVPTAVVDTLAANQRFLDGIRASGLAFDYEPMPSPEWAVTGGRQVLVGEVDGVRASGDHFVVTVVVQQAIPDTHVAERVDAFLNVGSLHNLTAADLDAVGGPVLVALPDQPLPADSPPEVWPYVDGFWLAVPDGIHSPYVDYSEMRSDWPPMGSVEELAGALTEALTTAKAQETALPIECSASWQNPPPLDPTGLTPTALQTANDLVRLAMSCDEDGLIARAIADGTEIAVAEGEVAEQLVTPDDSDTYIRLAATLAFPRDPEGDQHVFELEGWRVIIDSDGRWVEFSRE